MRLPARPTVLLIAAWLGGCSVFEQPAQMRGVHIDEAQMKQLVPGTTTRADATSLIGSPTTRATFDDNTWIYIGEVTRPRIGRVQGVESQDVEVLTFDQNGVLRDIRKLTGKDSKPVDVVSRTTPSPGSSASFMQQLLGNVGRYNPGIGGGGGSADNTSPSGRTSP